MTAVSPTDASVADEVAISDEEWLEFVAGCTDAVPYHHPAWAALIAETYGFRVFVLVLRDVAGHVIAGLPVLEVRAPLRPRRWVSLPYTDFLEPLTHDDEARARLVAELDARRREAGIASAEVRAALEGPTAHAFSEVCDHVLELGPDSEALYRTFKRSQIQRRIEQGQSQGTIVRRASEATDLTHVFYRLHALTRRRHGVPVQPRRFFELMWERIVQPGLGFVLIAEAEGTPAAAAVFLAWNRATIYKYSAAAPELLRFRPVHLILWDAIKWSCENGHRSFDFGRSEIDDEGLREFKRGWGTDERRLQYSVLADLPSRRSGRVPRALEVTIRHSPLFVTRLLGNVFYRYAA